MAEILTESFCERCGTRYTFESPARRTSPLGALGTVGRGLRNFVVSPDQSIDEAFAVARAENEQKATAHQLEAFHRTFNFCLSCRQYTCGTCWNPVEGRCQSCAPMPEAEMLPAAEVGEDAPVVAEAMAIARAAAVPVIELPPGAADAPEMEAPAPEAPDRPADARIGLEAPSADVVGEPFEIDGEHADPFANLAIEDLDVGVPELDALLAGEPEPEAIAGAEAQTAVESGPALDSILEAEPEPEPTAIGEADAEVVTEPEPAAIPQPEAEAVADSWEAPESEPEVQVEREASAEPEAVEPEAIEPEPAAPIAEPAVRRRASSLPSLPAGVSLDDEIAAYDLRVAALAEPPAAPASAPMPAATPMPAPISRPVVAPEPDRLRPAAIQSQAMRDASVTPQAVPQPSLPPVYVPGPVPELPAASPVALPAAQTTGTCGSCGLSLSATARFCRRCGTPQHLD